MNEQRSKQWWRWVLVLPATVAVYALASMVWVLMPLPDFAVRFLSSFTCPLGSVACGMLVAPAHRAWTAAVLSALLAAVISWLLLQTVQMSGFSFREDVIELSLSGLVMLIMAIRAVIIAVRYGDGLQSAHRNRQSEIHE